MHLPTTRIYYFDATLSSLAVAADLQRFPKIQILNYYPKIRKIPILQNSPNSSWNSPNYQTWAMVSLLNLKIENVKYETDTSVTKTTFLLFLGTYLACYLSKVEASFWLVAVSDISPDCFLFSSQWTWSVTHCRFRCYFLDWKYSSSVSFATAPMLIYCLSLQG